jgi:pilus assembly protein CpaC
MLGCSVSFTLLSTVSAIAEEQLLFERDRSGELQVDIGKFVNARTKAKVARLVVGDPEIATAVPLTDTTFYVLGKKEGRTNIAVYDHAEMMIGNINVEVGTDTADLQQTIRSAVPQARVSVDTVNGRIRLSGTAADATAQRRILEVAEQYSAKPVINAMTVAGGQQVLLEVRIVEATRNAQRVLGVKWSATFPGGGSITTGANSLPDGKIPFGSVVANIIGGGISADVLIQALEEKGLGRRLAEPNLTALSGEKASFLAGGEVPIPVASDEDRITLQFKEYGVRLNFTPTVLENGLINLKLEPEVSQVDETRVIKTGSIEVPAFITRRASTTIEVRDGQSFAMAGLLQTTQLKSQDQLPWLGQIPVLGALFRSSSFQSDETDLVIIVTPRLARPAKPGQRLRTPFDDARPANDPEFFLLGNMEVSSEMQERFITGSGSVGPYGHMINIKSEKSNAAKKIVKR